MVRKIMKLQVTVALADVTKDVLNTGLLSSNNSVIYLEYYLQNIIENHVIQTPTIMTTPYHTIYIKYDFHYGSLRLTQGVKPL